MFLFPGDAAAGVSTAAAASCGAAAGHRPAADDGDCCGRVPAASAADTGAATVAAADGAGTNGLDSRAGEAEGSAGRTTPDSSDHRRPVGRSSPATATSRLSQFDLPTAAHSAAQSGTSSSKIQ